MPDKKQPRKSPKRKGKKTPISRRKTPVKRRGGGKGKRGRSQSPSPTKSEPSARKIVTARRRNKEPASMPRYPEEQMKLKRGASGENRRSPQKKNVGVVCTNEEHRFRHPEEDPEWMDQSIDASTVRSPGCYYYLLG
jgi:hypothetical protein